MDRKSYIENFIKQMEDKYNPSERMRYAIRGRLAGLLDHNISDGAFYSLVNLAEETYCRISEVKGSICAARKSFAEISSELDRGIDSLGKAVEGYGEATVAVMQTCASMAGTLNLAGKVIAAQVKAIKKLDEEKGRLEDKVLEAYLRQNPSPIKA